MNLGLHVDDEEPNVLANRRTLKSDLGLPNEPIWLDQVHGTTVVNAGRSIERTADGAFSNGSGTVCVVMTADCLPLLLTTTKGEQVAAIHVGWRGLANGIVENAIECFSCQPEEIIAWAGPTIGPTKFEIGTEVRDQLCGDDLAYVSQSNNKLLANMVLLCEQKLLALGVSRFSCSHACTYSNEGEFFSYRRDGQCGRMASLIWIDAKL